MGEQNHQSSFGVLDGLLLAESKGSVPKFTASGTAANLNERKKVAFNTASLFARLGGEGLFVSRLVRKER